MAYLHFTIRGKLSYGNSFTVDGSDPCRDLYDTATYRISQGAHEVTVHSKNGSVWSCDGELRSDSAMLLRLTTDEEGNVIDTEYAISRLNSQQETAYGIVAKRLKLTYTKEKSTPEEDVDHTEDITINTESKYEAPPSAESSYTGTSGKKGGIGWIVAGVICLIVAVSNYSRIQTLALFGIIGAILLLIGMKKKKD